MPWRAAEQVKRKGKEYTVVRAGFSEEGMCEQESRWGDEGNQPNTDYTASLSLLPPQELCLCPRSIIIYSTLFPTSIQISLISSILKIKISIFDLTCPSKNHPKPFISLCSQSPKNRYLHSKSSFPPICSWTHTELVLSSTTQGNSSSESSKTFMLPKSILSLHLPTALSTVDSSWNIFFFWVLSTPLLAGLGTHLSLLDWFLIFLTWNTEVPQKPQSWDLPFPIYTHSASSRPCF